MAAILKITDGDRVLEFYPIDDNLLPIWVGMEYDIHSWSVINMNKTEVRELIGYLQKQLNIME